MVENSLSSVSVIPNISGLESKEFKISSRVLKFFDKLLVLQWKINKLGPDFLVSLFNLYYQIKSRTRGSRLTVVCETKWNGTKWDETKWKSVVCEMKICSFRNENL